MLRLGLTGGIGAGKSTVSKRLAELGGVLVDADVIAREVVEPGTVGLQELLEAFGDDILAADGSLDRPALAAKAFGDDASRATLNSIVHPLVGKRTAEIIEGAADDAVVIQDIPLLVEGKMGALFQLVAVVFADAEERVERLVGQRKMPETDARARIAAQATDEQRRAAADIWIDNSGAPDDLDDVVRDLWTERLVPFERNIRDGVIVRTHPELVPADPRWAAQAERIKARIAVAAGSSAVRIDHIGSTAVPGLDAKDVIDIQVTVASLDDADALAEPLRRIGFPRNANITADNPKPAYGIGGEADPALWTKRFHGSADPGRTANIHIRVDGWPGQQFALVFRDWLIADVDATAEYLEIKRAADFAAKDRSDYQSAIEAYVGVKEPWFDRAYVRAWEWAERTGWKA
ncbi:dephospho-CoA kinase [Rhodococcus sp. 06-156-3C]|uniref:dephospho-CoA kinase n=1 Tax=Nocardiaceae TaxID=85025 RepID=UPI000522E899|nr:MULTISPECIES: dephospho-CoA kinase [Rhodococcus]OZD13313.1 dephospho-CoA kinase [Rhodococcus sp. 06-156-4C]OZD16090.1 dephospho-CoA kinase [Rhodococcus sp. 06-156-3C]OZD17444.1 dephospho-CoA kinase [Rhodococcus sp. 06-156-4a]OZD34783.1 dephospho-CoA kinase [Rhodococcus sp. 06-156-3b]OZD36164.1 dephospho-CoA kinase [Rhodococcus sp. 06-156-3]